MNQGDPNEGTAVWEESKAPSVEIAQYSEWLIVWATAQADAEKAAIFSSSLSQFVARENLAYFNGGMNNCHV